MGILNILFLLPQWHRKTTLIELFFNKSADCYLTEKDFIAVSFIWDLQNFSDQLFSKIYLHDHTSLSSVPFNIVLTQNSILKFFFKSYRKVTIIGFFL